MVVINLSIDVAVLQKSLRLENNSEPTASSRPRNTAERAGSGLDYERTSQTCSFSQSAVQSTIWKQKWCDRTANVQRRGCPPKPTGRRGKRTFLELQGNFARLSSFREKYVGPLLSVCVSIHNWPFKQLAFCVSWPFLQWVAKRRPQQQRIKKILNGI